jgi:hypothetical protein
VSAMLDYLSGVWPHSTEQQLALAAGLLIKLRTVRARKQQQQ